MIQIRQLSASKQLACNYIVVNAAFIEVFSALALGPSISNEIRQRLAMHGGLFARPGLGVFHVRTTLGRHFKANTAGFIQEWGEVMRIVQ